MPAISSRLSILFINYNNGGSALQTSTLLFPPTVINFLSAVSSKNGLNYCWKSTNETIANVLLLLLPRQFCSFWVRGSALFCSREQGTPLHDKWGAEAPRCKVWGFTNTLLSNLKTIFLEKIQDIKHMLKNGLILLKNWENFPSVGESAPILHPGIPIPESFTGSHIKL